MSVILVRSSLTAIPNYPEDCVVEARENEECTATEQEVFKIHFCKDVSLEEVQQVLESKAPDSIVRLSTGNFTSQDILDLADEAVSKLTKFAILDKIFVIQ